MFKMHWPILATLLLMGACKDQSEAVKYADAPLADVPTQAGDEFAEFKDKKAGCATEEEVKEKLVQQAQANKPVALQGAKDADCTVK